MSDQIWDTVIIGSGPAGMAAGIYTARGLLSTLVIEKLGAGGQAALTDHIENYPGFPEGINGFDLANRMETQAKNLGVENGYGEVQSVVKSGADGLIDVKTDSGDYRAKTVLIASGASPKKLNVKGEEEFIGKGISFCATCDGALYRGKTVAVVGGGDSAVEEAMFLTKFAEKVYVIHRRDQLRATKIVQKRAFENKKIEFVWDSVVDEVKGTQTIESVDLKNTKNGSLSELKIEGLFLYIGLNPNTGFIDEVEKDENGYIITDSLMKSSIPGIFAAGDCRSKGFRQVSTAVGDGAEAANSIDKYIEELNHRS